MMLEPNPPKKQHGPGPESGSLAEFPPLQSHRGRPFETQLI